MSIGIYVKYDQSIHDEHPKINDIADSIIYQVKYIKKYYKINISSVQIFITGSNHANIMVRSDVRNKLKKLLDDKIINKLYVHSSYMSPLTDSKPIYIKQLIKQLEICNEIGVSGLVIHFQSNPKNIVVKLINEILLSTNCVHAASTQNNCILYFEHRVIKDKQYQYSEPDELIGMYKYILDHIDNKYKHLIGICIDTCHIWSNGIDISSLKKATLYIDNIVEELRVNKIDNPNIMIHLNDCLYPLGYYRDVHAQFGNFIWQEPFNKSGLKAFIDFAKHNNIDMILERTDFHSDMEILGKLI